MAIPNEMMNEKIDVERPSEGSANPDILNPLLLLLASRRGIRNDTLFAETAVPDDYVMRYQGKSGVEAINTKPLWKRIIFSLGIMSGKPLIVILTFNLVFLVASRSDNESDDKEYNRTAFWRHLRMGAYAASLTTFLFIAAKGYAKHMAATSTPPQYDPTSYQYRLVNAMEQRGLEYREIVAATPDDMSRYWKEEQALCEQFRIVGLVDPENASHVYDLVVRFYTNGGIYLNFPAADPTVKRSMVAVSANTS